MEEVNEDGLIEDGEDDEVLGEEDEQEMDGETGLVDGEGAGDVLEEDLGQGEEEENKEEDEIKDEDPLDQEGC